MTHPDPDHRTHEQRSAVESAVKSARESADHERQERRDVHDLTRQHARGAKQSQAGLSRERDHDDEDLVQERKLADRATAALRRTSDEAVAAAEDRLVDARLESDRHAQELRAGLKETRVELEHLEEILASLLRDAAGKAMELRLLRGVDLIRMSAERIGRLLEGALDAEDATSSHHDVGGSG